MGHVYTKKKHTHTYVVYLKFYLSGHPEILPVKHNTLS